MSAPYPDKAQEAAYPPQQYPPQQYPPQQLGGYAPVPAGDSPAYPPPQGQAQYAPPAPYPPAGGVPQAPPPAYPQTTQYGVSGQQVVVGVAPQAAMIVRQAQPQPNDYLVFAIFVTVCCCLPFGIVGIIKSMDVRNRYMAGDLQGAQEASRSAKNWSIAGLVTGLVLEVIGIILIVVYFVFVISSVATVYPY